jgi:uncharacterized protein
LWLASVERFPIKLWCLAAGIGYELAARLAQRGYDVAISGQAELVHAAAKQLRSQHGRKAWAHQAYAGTHEGTETFWQFVKSIGRPLKSLMWHA